MENQCKSLFHHHFPVHITDPWSQLLDPWSPWIPRIIEVRCIGLFLTHSLFSYRQKSSLRGNRRVCPPPNTFTVQQEYFRQDIDLVVVTTGVKKLKETVTLKLWRQWLKPFVSALFPSNIWTTPTPPDPTPKFNCHDRRLSYAAGSKETRTNIYWAHTIHKTLCQKLHVTI